ncbi:MAG: hypothetical protein L0H96_06965 [Humibacillus sp.]|nr:hypothetical protein [Humibacillus sp.]MDN5776634.1 hypothetical protein [Humibacillus sp.]
MRIYVAGPVADTVTVQKVQDAVLAAGHELTLDWSADVSFAEGFAGQIDRSARMAKEELDAVIAADAVLVVASQHDGRGMFVELGVALARASRGDLDHVVLIGEIHHESVFYFHPLVQRVPTVEDWFAQLH